MCGGSRKKHPRFAGSDSSSDEPVKSFRRDGTDRVRAVPSLSSSDLTGARITHRDVMGSDIYDGAELKVDKRYAGVGYRSSAVVASVCLDRDTASECMQRTGGCDWDNADVIEYVVQSEYLDSRRSCTFQVEGQVGRVVLIGKSQMTVYGAWNMRMAQ